MPNSTVAQRSSSSIQPCTGVTRCRAALSADPDSGSTALALEFAFDPTLAVANRVISKTLDRFPRMRLIATHSGRVYRQSRTDSSTGHHFSRPTDSPSPSAGIARSLTPHSQHPRTFLDP